MYIMNFQSVEELLKAESRFTRSKKKINQYYKDYIKELKNLEFLMYLKNSNTSQNAMKKMGLQFRNIPNKEKRLKNKRNAAPFASRWMVNFDKQYQEKNGSWSAYMEGRRIPLYTIMKRLKECNALPVEYETKPRLSLDDVKILVDLSSRVDSSGPICKMQSRIRANPNSIRVHQNQYKYNLPLPNRTKHYPQKSKSRFEVFSNSNNNL